MSERYLEPLGNHLLIETVPLPTKSAGGIHLVEQSRQHSSEGFVVAAGPGKRDYKGELIPPPVVPGDVVMFLWIHGQDVSMGTKAYKLLDADQLLGKIVHK